MLSADLLTPILYVNGTDTDIQNKSSRRCPMKTSRTASLTSAERRRGSGRVALHCHAVCSHSPFLKSPSDRTQPPTRFVHHPASYLPTGVFKNNNCFNNINNFGELFINANILQNAFFRKIIVIYIFLGKIKLSKFKFVLYSSNTYFLENGTIN